MRLEQTCFNEALDFAKENGYPLLLKAAAGGGGKGMRVVYQDTEVEDALARTKSEALSSFGDDRIFIEKFIDKNNEYLYYIPFNLCNNTINGTINFSRIDNVKIKIETQNKKYNGRIYVKNIKDQSLNNLNNAFSNIFKRYNYHAQLSSELIYFIDKSLEMFDVTQNGKRYVMKFGTDFYFKDFNKTLDKIKEISEIIFL